MGLKDFFLNIGGFTIHFYSDDNGLLFHLDDAYILFLAEPTENPTARVCVSRGRPFDLSQSVVQFKASNPEASKGLEKETLWSIHNYNDNSYIISSEPQKGIYPFLYAHFPEALDTWRIWLPESDTNNNFASTDPLAYPMGPLLMYHLALFKGKVMIHASGVCNGTNGYLFSGFSGVGKSTMAHLWHESGHQVINDDRLWLGIENDKCYMYNTPMTYVDKPRKSLLTHAFLIKQSPENYLKQVTGIEKMMRLMAFCIQHHYHKKHIQILMNTIENIAGRLKIYELGFVPEQSIVELIKNEQKRNSL